MLGCFLLCIGGRWGVLLLLCEAAGRARCAWGRAFVKVRHFVCACSAYANTVEHKASLQDVEDCSEVKVGAPQGFTAGR